MNEELSLDELVNALLQGKQSPSKPRQAKSKNDESNPEIANSMMEPVQVEEKPRRKIER